MDNNNNNPLMWYRKAFINFSKQFGIYGTNIFQKTFDKISVDDTMLLDDKKCYQHTINIYIFNFHWSLEKIGKNMCKALQLSWIIYLEKYENGEMFSCPSKRKEILKDYYRTILRHYTGEVDSSFYLYFN